MIVHPTTRARTLSHLAAQLEIAEAMGTLATTTRGRRHFARLARDLRAELAELAGPLPDLNLTDAQLLAELAAPSPAAPTLEI